MMFVLLFIQLLCCLNDVSCWSIGLMRVDEKEPWLVEKKIGFDDGGVEGREDG
jgi:hypothetical protein